LWVLRRSLTMAWQKRWSATLRGSWARSRMPDGTAVDALPRRHHHVRKRRPENALAAHAAHDIVYSNLSTGVHGNYLGSVDRGGGHRSGQPVVSEAVVTRGSFVEQELLRFTKDQPNVTMAKPSAYSKRDHARPEPTLRIQRFGSMAIKFARPAFARARQGVLLFRQLLAVFFVDGAIGPEGPSCPPWRAKTFVNRAQLADGLVSARCELYCNFNAVGVRSFILNGAPFQTKTKIRNYPGAFCVAGTRIRSSSSSIQPDSMAARLP
jgi:hypothetical protein